MQRPDAAQIELTSPHSAIRPLLISYVSRFGMVEEHRSDRRVLLNRFNKLKTSRTMKGLDILQFYWAQLDFCRRDLEPLEQKLLEIELRILR